jgi:hypothetical protein
MAHHLLKLFLFNNQPNPIQKKLTDVLLQNEGRAIITTTII